MLRFRPNAASADRENPFANVGPYNHRQRLFKMFSDAEVQSQAGVDAEDPAPSDLFQSPSQPPVGSVTLPGGQAQTSQDDRASQHQDTSTPTRARRRRRRSTRSPPQPDPPQTRSSSPSPPPAPRSMKRSARSGGQSDGEGASTINMRPTPALEGNQTNPTSWRGSDPEIETQPSASDLQVPKRGNAGHRQKLGLEDEGEYDRSGGSTGPNTPPMSDEDLELSRQPSLPPPKKMGTSVRSSPWRLGSVASDQREDHLQATAEGSPRTPQNIRRASYLTQDVHRLSISGSSLAVASEAWKGGLEGMQTFYTSLLQERVADSPSRWQSALPGPQSDSSAAGGDQG
jgi:hypothetical protein